MNSSKGILYKIITSLAGMGLAYFVNMEHNTQINDEFKIKDLESQVTIIKEGYNLLYKKYLLEKR